MPAPSPPPSPVYLDRRTGSAELYTPLQARSVPVQLTTLDYGDAAFVGRGPGGDVMVGIERKRIRDLLGSLTSGRLSGHQLPGLNQQYAYRWLLVEGPYRESARGGLIEVPGAPGKPWETIRFRYAALESYLLTLSLRGGVRLARTYSIEESCGWLDALWRWWTAKAFADHRSHLALHDAAGAGDHALFHRPTLVQRVAAQLPGIDERAVIVAQRFSTVLELACAGESEWTAIPGIGKTTARRIVQAIQAPKDES